MRFLVKTKKPTAKTKYIIVIPELLAIDAKVTGVLDFMNKMSLYFSMSRISFIYRVSSRKRDSRFL